MLPAEDPSWELVQRIWAGQKARGQVPLTREEIDTELEQLDNEAEEELQAIELHLRLISERCR
jgi:hypothetical protein